MGYWIVFVFGFVQGSRWLSGYSYPFYHLPPFKRQCGPSEERSLPTLLFPGCNDRCIGIDYFHWALERHSNSEVICIEYGHLLDSVFTSLESLVNKACTLASKHESILKDGFVAVGMSMGGLVARGLIQRCPIGEKASVLIAVGTPQAGVAKIPMESAGFFAPVLQFLFEQIVYHKTVQKFVSSTNFFKVPHNLAGYHRTNAFLATLNNESVIDPVAVARIERLSALVCVAFKQEKFIDPPESAHFGYYDSNPPHKVQSFFETEQYRLNHLGLRTLWDSGRLIFLHAEGRHQNLAYIDSIEFAQLIYFLF